VRQSHSNHFNLNTVLKALLLFGFAAFYLRCVLTGTVSQYVHPRIVPYLVFAAAVMIIIGVLLLLGAGSSKPKKGSSWQLIFFSLPLLMAFTLPPQPFAADTNAVGDLQLSSAAAGDEAQSNVGAIAPEGPIVIESGNYYPVLCDLYTDIDKYVGRTVTVTGFVFRDESFAIDQFVAARLLMVCCAADMQTVGLLCQYADAAPLETDAWVTVSGVLQKVPFGGEDVPCIAAESVEAAEEPEDAYIYPY